MKLARNVYTPDGKGWGPAFGNEADVPEDVAKLVTDPSAWEEGEAPTDGEPEAPAPSPDAMERPKGNAGHDEWYAYAVEVKGADPDEAAGYSRNELRALYGED